MKILFGFMPVSQILSEIDTATFAEEFGKAYGSVPLEFFKHVWLMPIGAFLISYMIYKVALLAYIAGKQLPVALFRLTGKTMESEESKGIGFTASFWLYVYLQLNVVWQIYCDLYFNINMKLLQSTGLYNARTFGSMKIAAGGILASITFLFITLFYFRTIKQCKPIKVIKENKDNIIALSILTLLIFTDLVILSIIG